MTIQELQESINLYQRIMDGCGKYPYSVAQAIRGEEPPEGYHEFQTLVEKAGLDVGFFSDADPLYVRAERERDFYVAWLEEKRLLQTGISIA